MLFVKYGVEVKYMAKEVMVKNTELSYQVTNITFFTSQQNSWQELLNKSACQKK
jgi:hypothetical protein